MRSGPRTSRSTRAPPRQPLARLLQPVGLRGAVPAGGDLRLALAFAHHHLGLPLVVPHLLPVAAAAVQIDAGLDQLALLTPDVRGGGPHGPLRRLLLGGDRLLVGGQVPAVPADRTVAELGDLVDQVQQRAVVADDHHHARPGGHGVVEAPPRCQVEVVGRLVQQQHVRSPKELRGQAEQHRLAARHLADAPLQADVAKAETVQGGVGAFVDIPVVADGGEVLLGGLAALDGA
jgi:hypothetical protein